MLSSSRACSAGHLLASRAEIPPHVKWHRRVGHPSFSTTSNIFLTSAPVCAAGLFGHCCSALPPAREKAIVRFEQTGYSDAFLPLEARTSLCIKVQWFRTLLSGATGRGGGSVSCGQIEKQSDGLCSALSSSPFRSRRSVSASHVGHCSLSTYQCTRLTFPSAGYRPGPLLSPLLCCPF